MKTRESLISAKQELERQIKENEDRQAAIVAPFRGRGAVVAGPELEDLMYMLPILKADLVRTTEELDALE